MSYKILVSDPLGEAGLSILNQLDDIEVIVDTGLEPDVLKQRLNEVDGVIIRSGTTITAESLEGNTSIKVIGRAGIGVDNIDLEAATEKGIVVMNTPSGNAITTAEHTISLMMSAARRIPQAYAKLRGGAWDRKSFVGTELSGKTLGIIGLGNIGALVVERAIGLKMNVVGFDPFVSKERAQQLGVDLMDMDDVIARADVLTLHVPKNEKTTNLINEQRLKCMKPGAILVNCARGGIVDEVALNDALNNGEISAAALDVFAQEPPADDNPLLQNDRMIYTPHLGASTIEAQTKVAVDVAQQVADFLLKGEVKNSVNAPSVSGEVLESLAPYMVLGSKMGALVAQLNDGPVEKICIKFGGEIAEKDFSPVVARTVTSILSVGFETPVNDVNALQVAKTRGIEIESTGSSVTEDFTSTIQIIIEGKGATTSSTGAVLGKNDPKIVRINSYRMEPLAPHGPLVFATNLDQPGVIGHIGTILGNAAVNIAQMHVGRSKKEKNVALTVLALDEPASKDVLDKLANLDEIVDVRQFEL